MIWAEGALQDDFLESVFFTGNGRMGGVRGYAAGDPQPRPVRQGLFLAGMFDEIKPGITDFIHLPTPVWHRILADGRPVAPVGSVRRTLDLACGPQPDAVPCQLPALGQGACPPHEQRRGPLSVDGLLRWQRTV